MWPEFVEARRQGESVALEIGRVIEEPDLRVFGPEPVEVPGQPAQHVIRGRIEPTLARQDRGRRDVRKRLAVGVVPLQEADVVTRTQRKQRVLQARRVEDALPEQSVVGLARGMRERNTKEIIREVGIQRAVPGA